MTDDGDWRGFLLDAPIITRGLDALAVQAQAALGDGAGCSIVLHHAGYSRVVASGSAESEGCDWTQVYDGEGPCVTALQTAAPVLVSDLSVDPRWPRWNAEAMSNGFRSAACLPTAGADGSIVSLNLYPSTADPWEASTLAHARDLSQQAARTVSLCLELAAVGGEPGTVEDAHRGRRQLEMDVKRAMAELGCSLQDALDTLRATAS